MKAFSRTRIASIFAIAILAVFTLVGTASAIAVAGPSIIVTPSLAPNAFGSPSWGAYVDNANYAIENDLSAYGDASLPSYYSALTSVTKSENVVTGFNSWMGIAPASAPYASELGNRMHFGLHILGSGAKFRLSNLSFVLDSDWDIMDFADNFFYPNDTYSKSRIGINYGADGIKGTADDIIFKNGEAASSLIDELVYVGVGNAPDVYTSDPGATLQDKVNNMLTNVPDYTMTTTYYLWNDAHDTVIASNSASVSTVPEPASILALVSGLAGLGLIRKRK